MLRFVAKRLLLAIPTLWAVLTLVFLLVRVVPGDPTIVVLGDQASPAAREALRHRLGLDKPILTQYAEFMTQIAQGDLGLEDVDLAGEILRHLSVEFFFPKRVGSLHYRVLSCRVSKFQGFKSFKVSSSKTGMSNLIR